MVGYTMHFPTRYAININKEVTTYSVSLDCSSDDNSKDLLDGFFLRVKRKIVHGREAYLLTDVLHDLHERGYGI